MYGFNICNVKKVVLVFVTWVRKYHPLYSYFFHCIYTNPSILRAPITAHGTNKMLFYIADGLKIKVI